MSGNLLDAMMAGAATSARERLTRDAMERAAAAQTPRGELFRSRLRAEGFQVIAECKRRSPSRGVLRVDYDPAAIARAYEEAGAAAVSVLTDGAFFDGSLEHLRAVRAAVRVPVLRKDFISEDFQLTEARAAGADAVLLIVAGLDDESLVRLHRRAEAEGLAVLVEVHDRGELDRAIDAGASIVGVNSRNLKTLAVDLALHDHLRPHIPSGVVSVAESGLRTRADLIRLRDAGYDAFLMGERFMTEVNPGLALQNLLSQPVSGGLV